MGVCTMPERGGKITVRFVMEGLEEAQAKLDSVESRRESVVKSVDLTERLTASRLSYILSFATTEFMLMVDLFDVAISDTQKTLLLITSQYVQQLLLIQQANLSVGNVVGATMASTAAAVLAAQSAMLREKTQAEVTAKLNEVRRSLSALQTAWRIIGRY